MFVEFGRARVLQNCGRLDLVNRLAFHPVGTGVARSTSPAINFDRIAVWFCRFHPRTGMGVTLVALVPLISGPGSKGKYPDPGQGTYRRNQNPKVRPNPNERNESS